MCNDDYFGQEFKRSVKCFLERIEKYYHVLINFCIFLSVVEIFGRKSCSVHSFSICNKKKTHYEFFCQNFNLVSILLRGQILGHFPYFFFFLINGKTDENNRIKIRIFTYTHQFSRHSIFVSCNSDRAVSKGKRCSIPPTKFIHFQVNVFEILGL